MDYDVVFVGINYRLGALGFFALENQAFGNQGLRDQTMALLWVHQNIHHFGGDPAQVTIFGESSGSCSVFYQCITPLAEGLFHRAIAQSGGIWVLAWETLLKHKKRPTRWALMWLLMQDVLLLKMTLEILS